jgi:hypothetical protein
MPYTFLRDYRVHLSLPLPNIIIKRVCIHQKINVRKIERMNKMKGCLLFVLIAILSTIILSACAANKGITVDESFWNDRRTAIGIVFASLPEPEVTVKIGSTTMSRKERTLVMSRRYQQDFNREPMILRDQRDLWHYLDSHEVDEMTSIVDVLAERLEAQGFRPVRIKQQIDLEQVPDYVPETSGYGVRDFRKTSGVQGLDLLIILHVQRYGVYCYYLDYHNIYTDVNIELAGEMVDLKTNRLKWRSPFRPGWIKRTVPCKCEDPNSYPLIIEEIGGALVEAAGNVADDFFSSAPK